MTAILKVDTIQDTAGNNIINESSNTITIGKSGDAVNLASGATNNLGITEADQFRLTADLTANADPISSNLERVDDATFSKIGTGMSLSSGIYTFPVTGLYLVSSNTSVSYSGSDNVIIEVYASSDSGSSFDLLVKTISGTSTAGVTNSMTSSNFVNVTNASTFRIKFAAASVTNANIQGVSGYNRTYFTFIRLGDSQ